MPITEQRISGVEALNKEDMSDSTVVIVFSFGDLVRVFNIQSDSVHPVKSVSSKFRSIHSSGVLSQGRRFSDHHRETSSQNHSATALP